MGLPNAIHQYRMKYLSKLKIISMRSLCSLITCLIFSLISFGQTTFQKIFSAPQQEIMKDLTSTSDGGFIGIGFTRSFGQGDSDIYVLKLDENGNKEWDRTYGSVTSDGGQSIIETADGDFMLAGFKSGLYVAKIDDAFGDLIWEKTYGSGVGYDIMELGDTTYVVGGTTTDFGTGGVDMVLLHIDGLGSVLSSNTYGGGMNDVFFDLIVTQTGDILSVGETSSFGDGGYMVKTDTSGDILWSKAFAASEIGGGYFSVTETSSGNYVAGGRCNDASGAGSMDWWVTKTDTSGNVIWNKTYGGFAHDQLMDVIETPIDSGLVLFGYSGSFGPIGNAVLTKLDYFGSLEWSVVYGGSDFTNASSVVKNEDGFTLLGDRGLTNSDILLIGTSTLGRSGCQDSIVTLSENSFIPTIITGGVKSTGGAMSVVTTQNGVTSIAENIICFNECNMTVELELSQETGGAGCDGEISVSVLNGSAPISYQWDENAGNQTTSIATNLCAGDYCVNISDDIGCLLDTCVSLSFTVGTSVNSETGFEVYPNPSNGFFSLLLGDIYADVVTCSVINHIGQVVYSKSLQNRNNFIDLTFLESGLYLMNIQEEGETTIQSERIILLR